MPLACLPTGLWQKRPLVQAVTGPALPSVKIEGEKGLLAFPLRGQPSPAQPRTAWNTDGPPSHRSLLGPFRAPGRPAAGTPKLPRKDHGATFPRLMGRCSHTQTFRRRLRLNAKQSRNENTEVPKRGVPLNFPGGALEEIVKNSDNARYTYCVQVLTSLDLPWIKRAFRNYTLQESKERLRKLRGSRDSNPRQPDPLLVTGLSMTCSVVTDKEVKLSRVGENKGHPGLRIRIRESPTSADKQTAPVNMTMDQSYKPAGA